MIPVVSHAGGTERIFQKQLRERVRREIRRRQLTPARLAKRLDLLPSGAEALMERDTWPIEITLWIAERLQMKVIVALKPKR